MAKKRTMVDLPLLQAQKVAYLRSRLTEPSFVTSYAAAALGVKPNQVWRWTHGGIIPTDEQIEKILDFFDDLDARLRSGRPRRERATVKKVGLEDVSAALRAQSEVASDVPGDV